MKNLFLFFVLAVAAVSISSCKKCFTCTKTCATCVDYQNNQTYSNCTNASELAVAKANCVKASCISFVQGSNTGTICKKEYDTYGFSTSWDDYVANTKANDPTIIEHKGTWTETPSSVDVCEESSVTTLTATGYTCKSK